jgi:hypothetical protein
MSAVLATAWRCPTCRAIGSVDVRADATDAERTAFAAAAHQIKQPRCEGAPEVRES